MGWAAGLAAAAVLLPSARAPGLRSALARVSADRVAASVSPSRAAPVLPGRFAAVRVVGWRLGRRIRPGSAQRRAEGSALAASGLAEAWAAELRAGRSAGQALRLASADVTDEPLRLALTPVVSALALGADPVVGLRRAAAVPGCGLLRLLAAAWLIGASRGSALAAAVERIAASGESDLQHQREVSAELAGPRATARLLAGLPVLAWLLGAGFGAAPWTFLVGTVPGAGVAAVGVALEGAGLAWTNALARAAEDTT